MTCLVRATTKPKPMFGLPLNQTLFTGIHSWVNPHDTWVCQFLRVPKRTKAKPLRHGLKEGDPPTSPHTRMPNPPLDVRRLCAGISVRKIGSGSDLGSQGDTRTHPTHPNSLQLSPTHPPTYPPGQLGTCSIFEGARFGVV